MQGNNVRPGAMLEAVGTRRAVDLRPRTILRVLLIVLAVGIALEVVWLSAHAVQGEPGLSDGLAR